MTEQHHSESDASVAAPAHDEVHTNAALAAPPSGPGRGLTLIALVAALAGLGWSAWQQQRLQALEQAEQSSLQTSLSQALAQQQTVLEQYAETQAAQQRQFAKEMQEQLRQVDTQLQQGRNQQQELLAQVEGRMATVDGQQARIGALQSRMDALVERLETLRQVQQPTLKLRWQGALDLLAVGRAQALFLERPAQAMQHYRAARELLLEQADSDSAQVISLIDEELRRLQAQPIHDVAADVAQIEAQLSQLPLWQPLQASPTETLNADAGWWEKLKFYARKPFSLRRADALDEIDVAVLRQALHLQLMGVEVALLMHDEAALQGHLQHALDLLEQYGSGGNAELAALLPVLQQLQQRTQNALPAPALGQAEERLRRLLHSSSAEVTQ